MRRRGHLQITNVFLGNLIQAGDAALIQLIQALSTTLNISVSLDKTFK